MMLLLVVFLTLLISCDAFISSTNILRSRNSMIMGINPVASGFATTRAGKAAAVERTKALIDQSSLIMTVPLEGTNVEEIDALRNALPEGTTASVVKNTLMRVAVKDTPFANMGDQADLSQSNIFFFIPEGESKPTFKALEKWAKGKKTCFILFD